jgi:hypothetical protein
MVAAESRLDDMGTLETFVQIHVDAYMLTLRIRKSAKSSLTEPKGSRSPDLPIYALVVHSQSNPFGVKPIGFEQISVPRSPRG